jgi:hypothetical protein
LSNEILRKKRVDGEGRAVKTVIFTKNLKKIFWRDKPASKEPREPIKKKQNDKIY